MIRLIDGDSVTEISVEDANVLLNAWNKEKHISEISLLHDELFNSILVQHNYTSFAELSIWTQEPTNEYYTEANAIKEWYRSTWMAIKEYSETVTEETAVEPKTFIDNLPKLLL
jgi:hypothetical protein